MGSARISSCLVKTCPRFGCYSRCFRTAGTHWADFGAARAALSLGDLAGCFFCYCLSALSRKSNVKERNFWNLLDLRKLWLHLLSSEICFLTKTPALWIRTFQIIQTLILLIFVLDLTNQELQFLFHAHARWIFPPGDWKTTRITKAINESTSVYPGIDIVYWCYFSFDII